MLLKVKNVTQRLWLKYCHQQGQKHNSTIEPYEPHLISLGQSLRQSALSRAENSHAKTPYRILLSTPPSMAAEVWFSDLEHGLRIMGIPHLRLPFGTPLTKEHLSSFQPNVVMALDHDSALKHIDLIALKKHKTQHSCLRLFIPSREDLFKRQPTLRPPDAKRLAKACAGQTADAYFSLYDERLYSTAYRPWYAADFPYLSLPQACNPVEDYPRRNDKNVDWFTAVVNNPARLNSVWNNLRPILKNHHGHWVGQGWGFGQPPVPPSFMPNLYSQSKISLAPLISFLIEHPAELSHRVFEAAACGAFQLTSISPITHKFFSKKALITVERPSEFFEVFRYWLPRTEERNRVAEEALQEVYSRHTVFERIEQLILFLDQQNKRF